MIFDSGFSILDWKRRGARGSGAPVSLENRKSKTKNSSRRGVVIAITLMGLFLLCGLVLFVMNLGQQANGRLVAQNAADATAAAGAGWVARTLNTVAMNNVGMAQLITSVNVLDAMPEAVDYSLIDQTAMQQAVRDQLGRAIRESWVRDELNNVASELDQEVAWLQPVDEVLKIPGGSYDIRDLTYYEGPGGRGKLWQAMEAMDLYNQTAMANLGLNAQLNAVRGGLADLSGATGETIRSGNTAFLVPVLPTVPYQRGKFDDFYQPVAKGLLPPTVDDKKDNRGPYDAVFGWRDWIYSGSTGGGTSVTGQGDSGTQAHGKSSWSGNWPPGNASSRHIIAYAPYGPFRYTMDQVSGFTQSHLRYSRFDQHVDKLAVTKLGYLWPQEAVYPPDRPLPLKVRGYRNAADRAAGKMAWEIDLVKDYRYWFDGPNMQRTNPPSNYFYLEDGVNTTSNDLVLLVKDLGNGRTSVTYISQATMHWIYDVVAPDGTMVLEGLGQGMNGRRTGTYSTDVPTPPNQAIRPRWVTNYESARSIAQDTSQHIYHTAWLRMRFDRNVTVMPDGTVQDSGVQHYDTDMLWVNGTWLEPAGLGDSDRVDSYIWLDEYPIYSSTDPQTGITTQVRHSVYYVFMGIDVGTPQDIRNPFNFASRNQLVAPTDLDHSQLSPLADARRQYLTYLAVVRRPDTALLWPTKFQGGKPDAAMLALAQVEVYNNHSFDLWTQMWGSQVERVADLPQWVNRLDQTGSQDMSQMTFLSVDTLQPVEKYLKNIEPLANVMLTH